MAKTIEDLSTEVADLKDALLKKTEELTYKVPNPKKEEVEKKPFVDETAKVSSALKHHLVAVVPQITTENFIKEFFAGTISKIKDIHTEATKNQWTEFMEATPIVGGFAAALEKWFESKEEGAKVAWQNWLFAALAGALMIALLPAIRGLIVNGWRFAQTKRRGDDSAARDQRRIWTKNADGGWGRETLGAVKQREQRVWNGGTSLADLVSDPANAARAEALRKKLVPLNRAVDRFNKLAPTFQDLFGKLPSEAKATKAASGVKKISDAVNLVNTTKLKAVAEGFEKLNLALNDFQPTKIPKETDIAGTASAMNNLAKETGTLRTKFEELRGTIRSLDQQIGAATT
ncbi:hypothetical protein ABZY16_27615 [Streptomyces sp. NPDC006553]|uniref:hypothetical protein n=1 Tax=Streptomyces sp. NPDC006553 TaxID=3157180 RepID=UPI0033A8EB9E